MTDERIELQVGARIQAYRKQQGYSLRALAERAGLSANAVSLIERGENSPTVSSLRRLADGLGVPITAFFQEAAEQITLFVRRDQGPRYQSQGMLVESLGTGLPNQQLEALAITVEPGHGNLVDPISHSGEEFVRCLTGRVDYHVGESRYSMEAGDSLLFDSSQPHAMINTSAEAAQVLVVFHAGDERFLARRQHQEMG